MVACHYTYVKVQNSWPVSAMALDLSFTCCLDFWNAVEAVASMHVPTPHLANTLVKGLFPPIYLNLPRVFQPLPKIYILEDIFLTHQSTLVWTAFLLSITALIRIRPDLFTCNLLNICLCHSSRHRKRRMMGEKKKYLTIAYHWTMFLKICFHFFSP